MACEHCGETQGVETYAVGYHHEGPNQAVGEELCKQCSEGLAEDMESENGFVIPVAAFA